MTGPEGQKLEALFGRSCPLGQHQTCRLRRHTDRRAGRLMRGIRACGIGYAVSSHGVVRPGAGRRRARAPSVADFYKGKQISWILSADAGGGYASYALAFAPYLDCTSARQPEHRRAEHARRRRHPRDDLSALASRRKRRHHHRLWCIRACRLRRSTVFQRRKFDPRQLNWIGSINAAASASASSWHTSPDQDLARRAREAVHRRRLRRGLADGNPAGDAQQVVRHEDAR